MPRRRSSATPRYDPLPRSSTDSISFSSSSSSAAAAVADEFKDKPLLRPRTRSRRLSLLVRKSRRYISRFCRPVYIAIFLSLLLAWQLLFNGSYTDSSAPKYDIAEFGEEKVFIAANIIDGDLIKGAWGRSLLELVERIGKERVFVSIYGGPKDVLQDFGELLECEKKIVFEGDDPVDLGSLMRTRLPTGESRIKRIAFLAEVRNRVLEPLRDGSAWKAMSGGGIGDMVGLGKKGGFEKVLFINDVFFDAEGATRLLWGTNVPGNGGYKAICAADFVTSWKYYDTFATRDAEGYSIGVPLFPWFAAEGDAASRNDVLAGKDAVRVKSCWGGMVAFDGRYFQSGNSPQVETVSASQHGESQNSPKENGKKVDGVGIPELPLKFRSEAEPFWDSSECCLIHADIMSLPSFPPLTISSPPSNSKEDDLYNTGIYMNPYVRTSYSSSAHRHIWLAKRFERLFSPLQRILNYFAHMPRFNYRRAEKEGQVVKDQLWISVHSNMTEEQSIALASGHGIAVDEDKGVEKRATLGTVRGKEYWANEGYYVPFDRVAHRGGYCGVRQLLVLKEGATEGGNWDNLLDKVPPVDI